MKFWQNKFNNTHKKIIHNNQVEFILSSQKWFNILKSKKVIHHIKEKKREKLHDHLNICRKSIWQNSTSIHDKNSYYNRYYLNIIKATYDKCTANIILNGEKLKALPLKSGTRQEYSLSTLLLNIVLEVLVIAIRQ